MSNEWLRLLNVHLFPLPSTGHTRAQTLISCPRLVTLFLFTNRMQWKTTNRGRSRSRQWERSCLLRRLNSMTPRYSQSACNWAEWKPSDVYSVLNKALWCAKKHSEQYKYPPLCWCRSRPRRRGISNRSWSQSCASDKPKTTGPCTRGRTALLRTSSQVGQTTL